MVFTISFITLTKEKIRNDQKPMRTLTNDVPGRILMNTSWTISSPIEVTSFREMNVGNYEFVTTIHMLLIEPHWKWTALTGFDLSPPAALPLRTHHSYQHLCLQAHIDVRTRVRRQRCALQAQAPLWVVGVHTHKHGDGCVHTLPATFSPWNPSRRPFQQYTDPSLLNSFTAPR